MIARVAVGPAAPWYRLLSPEWAHQPESGAGAASKGGRFNWPGLEARYLASTPDTAAAEYRNRSALMPPGTLATFLVTASPIVDLTRPVADEELPLWREYLVDWETLWFGQRIYSADMGHRAPRARRTRCGRNSVALTTRHRRLPRALAGSTGGRGRERTCPRSGRPPRPLGAAVTIRAHEIHTVASRDFSPARRFPGLPAPSAASPPAPETPPRAAR